MFGIFSFDLDGTYFYSVVVLISFTSFCQFLFPDQS